MKTLHIGKGFDLPLDMVVKTQAILARKRSGKSYTASVQAEEMLAAKQQISVIDPTSAWYGLRSSADGKGAGFPIVVFGGDHPDAPLDYRAGKAMAAAFVQHGFSAIFDIGNLRTEEQVQFVMEFCSELLRINRNAIHVFMDEADTFAPQKPIGLLQQKCLGTVSRLVKQGGIKGVGFTMITQRPASINKDILSQVDVLTVLRMSHPLDIKAATDWLHSETTKEFAQEVKDALPALPVGTAFFASASMDIAQRVEVRKRHTFNSGASPRPGERKVEPKVLAQIDIEKLGKEITASVQRTREESPEYLKKRIIDLEAVARKVHTKSTIDPERERMLLQQITELQKTAGAYEKVMAYIYRSAEGLKAEADRIQEAIRLAQDTAKAAAVVKVAPIPASYTTKPVVEPPVRDKPAQKAKIELSGVIASGERKVLEALATLESCRVLTPSRPIVAVLAGYSNAKSGGFTEPTAKLVSRGLIESSSGTLQLTDAGRSNVMIPDVALDSSELQERVMGILNVGEKRILTLLIAAYPEAVTRERLSEGAGYSNPKSGGFTEPVARLAGLGFAETPRGAARCSPMLWLES